MIIIEKMFIQKTFKTENLCTVRLDTRSSCNSEVFGFGLFWQQAKFPIKTIWLSYLLFIVLLNFLIFTT